MKHISSLATLALLTVFAASAACLSTEIPGPGQDAGTASDATLASDAALPGDAAFPGDAGTSADVSAPNDAGSGPDVGGPVVITGLVSTLTTSQPTPLAKATVEIVGVSPANSTTTGADGTYSLTVAPGTYFVRASMKDMMSAQVGVVTLKSTAVTELSLISASNVRLITGALQITLDRTKGIVAVVFDTSDTGGGYKATLSAAAETSFALPKNGWPPEPTTSTLSEGGNALFFINVAPHTTTATFIAPNGHSCEAQLPISSYPIDENVVTAIGATCE